MKKLSFVSALLLGLFVLTVAAQAGMYDKYLSAADVSKLTGLQAVTMKADASELTFRSGKHLFLTVRFTKFTKPQAYTDTKKTVATTGKITQIKGIGEDAFSAAALGSDVDYLIYVKKGNLYVTLTDFYSSERISAGKKGADQLYLTMDQLKAIAKLIASKL